MREAPQERKQKSPSLTLPDLVLLSLLAERPMHGYQANAELERRQVRDWAAVSRPQVYYSLEKLARVGLLRQVHGGEAACGPERRVFQTTDKGRTALADALERRDWAIERERPRFLTWIALSWQARSGIFEEQIARRRKFLETQLARERATLRAVRKEVGHAHHEAVWAVGLMVENFETELCWLRKLRRDFPSRAPARHPRYASGGP